MVTAKDLSVRWKANPTLVLGVALGIDIVPERHARCYLFNDDQAARLGEKLAAIRELIRPHKPKPKRAQRATP